jgi:hypothetical protein
MATRRLTIQDVAEDVGLSKFSVPRALSGKPGVGEATRACVLRESTGPVAAKDWLLHIRKQVPRPRHRLGSSWSH